jgi:3-methyladenine DNA glycosylase/8-oxoguanine DNA glycosylase
VTLTVALPAVRRWRPSWPCDPYDVLRPLRRGSGDPAFQHDADGVVWRASLTPEGPVTLRIARHAPLGEIEIAGWGRNPHWRVPSTGRVLESLVPAVIEQKVTGQEAWLGWRRLVWRFGETAPGPGTDRRLRVPPGPPALLTIPSWEWLRCRIDGARSKTIVRAARVADSLERTVGLDADEVERRLRSIPGVGVWTAAEVRQRAHGDADAVSFGDYHIARHVGWALTGEEIDDDALSDLLEPDRPHRYRVQHVVTTRLQGRPRRGPRMAPRRHLPG